MTTQRELHAHGMNACPNTSCIVFHCVQLSNSDEPGFVLHIKPASADPGNQLSACSGRMISRAGEGPGLQVFPGSVPEVTQVREDSISRGHLAQAVAVCQCKTNNVCAR